MPSPAARFPAGRWCGLLPIRNTRRRVADLEALSQLAHAYRIDPFWYDIWGNRHEVSHETLRALLGAMHVPAATDEAVRSSLAAHRARIWAESVPPVLVVRVSEQPLRLI